MSSTNKTTYYELPQFVDNDIFNPLVDDNDAYDKIDTALHNIADAEANDASDIIDIKSRLDSAENDIDALEAQNGDDVLTTTAQTLSGAVNELDAENSALDGRLDIVEDDINNVSTGLKAKLDAEVDNRIAGDASLNAKIDANKMDAKFVLMPVTKDETALGNRASGDCSVFITPHGKVIMIDSGSDHSYTEIKAELENLNVTFIDYFILTHFHIDHQNNIQSLLTDGYMTTETVSYVPRETGSPVSDAENEDATRALLANTIVRTPSSNNPLIVDGMTFDFFNCDKSDYDYYDANPSAYENDYCVCCYVTYKGVSILMTGDLDIEGMKHVCAIDAVHQCDILKMPHHGYGSFSEDFFLRANPTKVVVSLAIKSIKNNLDNWGRIKICNVLGSDVYCSGYGAITTGMNDHLYDVLSVSPKLLSNKDYYFTLYVDATSSEMGIGSATKPFKNLNDAIAFAGSLGRCSRVVINIVGEYTTTEITQIQSMPCRLRIAGTKTGDNYNVHLNGNIVIGHSYVEFDTIQQTFTGQSIANDYLDATVRLFSCLFDGEQKTGSIDLQRCFGLIDCILDLDSCTINDKGAIMSARSTNFNAYNLHGSRNGYVFFGSDSNINTSGSSDIEYTNLAYPTSLDFFFSLNNVKEFSDHGQYMLLKHVSNGSVTTIDVDLNSPFLNGAEVEVWTSNGDVYIFNVWTSSLSSLFHAITGTIQTSHTFNVSINSSTKTLTIEHDETVRVFVKR